MCIRDRLCSVCKFENRRDDGVFACSATKVISCPAVQEAVNIMETVLWTIKPLDVNLYEWLEDDDEQL